MRGKQFQKGHKGFKKKGAEHKTTRQAKELILAAIDSQSERFNEVMNNLQDEEPREWAKIMVKLIDYVLPKKVDMDIKTDGEKLNTWIMTPVEKK